MREDISQLASFVNGPWSLWGAVTADAAGERELLKEFPEAFFVLAFFWIDFAVGALQIDWRQALQARHGPDPRERSFRRHAFG